MSGRPYRIVFSDLDGTLLDFHTYGYRESLPGISLLKEQGIPLVLVSSKTFTEMKGIHVELELSDPFVFENGGGIAYPGSAGPGFFRIELLGGELEALKAKLPVLKAHLDYPVRTILEMDLREFIERSGLDGERALLARERRNSIPFVLLTDRQPGAAELEGINRRLGDEGLLVSRGGRFYHFSFSGASKGAAVKRLLSFYRAKGAGSRIVSIGIGDSENDIPMFRAVEKAFLVRRHDGSYIDAGTGAVKTEGIGPAGFTEAVESLLS